MFFGQAQLAAQLPQGLAFEVHNAFADLDLPKFMSVVRRENNGASNFKDPSNVLEPVISYINGSTSQYVAGDGSLITFPTIPTVGTWGALNYPTWTTGTPFVKMTAAGTFALDTNAYLTGITSLQVTIALGYTPPPNTRTITINGVTQDLSADRTFTVSAGNTAGINLANYYNFF